MNRDELRYNLRERFVLISCEGTHERVIASQLIEEGRLVVPFDHLIEDEKTGKPYTSLRGTRDIAAKFLRYSYPSPNGDGKILLARITDKEAKTGRADKVLSARAIPVDFVTRPEIEALIVIGENAQREWDKAREKTPTLKISSFCIESLGLKDVKAEAFLRDYWADVNKLVSCIEQYHRLSVKRGRKNFDLSDLVA